MTEKKQKEMSRAISETTRDTKQQKHTAPGSSKTADTGTNALTEFEIQDLLDIDFQFDEEMDNVNPGSSTNQQALVPSSSQSISHVPSSSAHQRLAPMVPALSNHQCLSPSQAVAFNHRINYSNIPVHSYNHCQVTINYNYK